MFAGELKITNNRKSKVRHESEYDDPPNLSKKRKELKDFQMQKPT